MQRRKIRFKIAFWVFSPSSQNVILNLKKGGEVMKVYSWDGWKLKEVDFYIKETDMFFIRSNGSRDKKKTSYNFLSQDKQEVINHIISKSKRVVDLYDKQLNEFEDRKRIELKRLHESLDGAKLDYEKTIKMFQDNLANGILG